MTTPQAVFDAAAAEVVQQLRSISQHDGDLFQLLNKMAERLVQEAKIVEALEADDLRSFVKANRANWEQHRKERFDMRQKLAGVPPEAAPAATAAVDKH